MKIVHIEDFFHPDAGYQVNILSKYQAKSGHDVTIVTMRMDKTPKVLLDFFEGNDIQEKDAKFTKEYGVKIIRVPVYAYISGRAIYTRKIFSVIDEIKPDILYVHGNDTYIGIRYIMKLGRLRFPIISDNHMLDAASKNRFNKLFYQLYRTFITPKIIKYHMPVIRTVKADFVQKRLGIPEKLSPVIGFGSDLMLFHRDLITREEVRKNLSISQNSFVIVYAGKLDESKGGLFLAEALKNKFDCSKEVSCIIIGNFVGEYGEKVLDLFNSSENCITILPTQKYNELAKYYQASDVAVFPKACSLSFYDVQACGLPVIAEDSIDVNVERLSHNNGYCFESDNINDFRKKICLIAELESSKFLEVSDSAIDYIAKNFDYRTKLEEYNRIINEQINK